MSSNFGDVLLRGIAVIGIAGRAHVERHVELDAALPDVRRVIGIGERINRAVPEGFGDIQSAVHRARGVGAQNGNRGALAADCV
jgi:hypothetical protein